MSSKKATDHNDVKILSNSLVKILKATSSIDDTSDIKETLLDILSQLKQIPLVNEVVSSSKIDKVLTKLMKVNTSNDIDVLLKELIHKFNHDGKKDNNVKGKKKKIDDNAKDNSNESSVRKSSRVVKNKVSTYNEDDLAESNIIVDTTTTSGGGSSSSKKTLTIEVSPIFQPIPNKNKDGILIFPDYPQFKPNLTPKEILQLGSFGGTYYRVIDSGVTGLTYHDAWKEFPSDWYEGLIISKHVSSSVYDKSVNYYQAKCGGDLHMWESSGWITAVDPFGW